VCPSIEGKHQFRVDRVSVCALEEKQAIWKELLFLLILPHFFPAPTPLKADKQQLQLRTTDSGENIKVMPRPAGEK
jgi:hypothetical protein